MSAFRNALAASLIGLASASASLAQTVPPETRDSELVRVEHPDWSHDAVLYQINLRQFTSEGSIAAAEAELPRLAELGVDILWLMPVQPIGVAERKGELGSPYSISDYRAVNPELGTMEDMRAFIDAAHELGFHVILDWVANHSAWDNPLIEAHPDWYSRDWRGDMQPPPGTDWSDVADFDYGNADLRDYMAESMAFWVREVGFDGFRCDVAGFVPIDFWERVRAEFDAIRPVFMLAEWEQRDLHRDAFDATYAWTWNNTMHDVAMGHADAGALRGHYFYEEANSWPRDAYRMRYTSNHDQNSWEGTQFERFGDALEAAIILSFTGSGIPLIYNGQEAGNQDRLAFFQRDPIEWREHPLNALFRDLVDLRHANSALWAGAAGAPMHNIENSHESSVFSFLRQDSRNAVLTAINFSAAPVQTVLHEGPHQGLYRDWQTGESIRFEADTMLELRPWEGRVFIAIDE
ncbi:alpha-amylase family glycosyl hydrolase [Maricaulis maris]|uniref:Maltogenic amylase n=1 Tax=Maricaulis maris TaxID=74318 RepID=A0A495CXU5_9PROT|nr:alpha-amylase family glycosyl hydrolase [Maricaulis maris]RKQ94116.1 maltogenic amylase [Maricaulis maris]